MAARTLSLNGVEVGVSVPDETQQLLYVLREQCGQRGPKFGCGIAQCGSCTVILDGVAVRSCTLQLAAVPDGASVQTLDGLAKNDNHMHPMQQAFVDLQAGQCAFCVNGMIMGATAWIESRIAAGNHSVPGRDEIADYLSGAIPGQPLNYICRCGAHNRIMDAIQAGAKEMV
jgi:aerobic-type carbon monoxide dehydrogenase small subunit (CoxS/CutS family)